MRFSEILNEMKCWTGYHKTGTQPGTGKNAGKRVNKCEPNEAANPAQQAAIAIAKKKEKSNESLDADQKRVGQVGGKEKAKPIGQVLAKPPKQHPFKGRLVGEELEEGYGKYWCSTDKRWKERKGPKQTRSS
jgi:hypothetical protein